MYSTLHKPRAPLAPPPDDTAAPHREVAVFSHNEQGNITFNGEPFIYSSLGASAEGQRRAARFAAWLNECLRKAQTTG